MSRSLSRNTSLKFRIAGVDDGAVPAFRKAGQETILVAVLFHGLAISGMRVDHIGVDGRDVNSVLARMLKGGRLDVVMLSGISFGGFNLVDLAKLARDLRKPVVAISRDKPDNAAVRRALQTHFDDWRDRWRMVQNAGPLYAFKPLRGEPKLYFEVKGASPSFAKTAIASTAAISRLPEPIRVAGMVARALSRPL